MEDNDDFAFASAIQDPEEIEYLNSSQHQQMHDIGNDIIEEDDNNDINDVEIVPSVTKSFIRTDSHHTDAALNNAISMHESTEKTENTNTIGNNLQQNSLASYNNIMNVGGGSSLLERIQLQKKLQPNKESTFLARSDSLSPKILSPPPAHVFAHNSSANTKTAPLTTTEILSTSSEQNDEIMKATSVSDDTNSSTTGRTSHHFTVHPWQMNQSLMFSRVDNETHVTPLSSSSLFSSPKIPNYSKESDTSSSRREEYKDKIMEGLTTVGNFAAHAGYWMYHKATTSLSSQISSNSTNGRREMDYQRQSLLMDPHEDYDLYDDNERQQPGGGNLSDSILGKQDAKQSISAATDGIHLHRKHQKNWRNHQQLQQMRRNDMDEDIHDQNSFLASIPLSIKISAMAVAVLIIWLLFS